MLVSVIIPVANESKTIMGVLRQVFSLPAPVEAILVVNGSTDRTRDLAERSGAKVIFFDRRLGHDVGRSVGAKAAQGDILLFVDGDFAVSAGDLMPFIHACGNGVDVALNRYNGPVARRKVHRVVLAKHALNVILGREDLQGASMTTVPHAMTRNALERIGAEHLAVPPKAQAIAVHRALNVQAVHRVDVGRRNPIRRTRYKVDPLLHLILGDHLEAIHWSMEATDERMHRADTERNRERVVPG